MGKREELFVQGYRFDTLADAELARQEAVKIEYMEKHMDYSSKANMLLAYQKAVDTGVFQTPVGWDYLKKMQDQLFLEGIDPSDIPPIPLRIVFGHEAASGVPSVRERIKPAPKKEPYKAGFRTLLIFCLLLAGMVIAMFTITVKSDNPNILNYQRALEDRYASWEQELTEREQTIREKERNLNIDQ